MRDMLEEETADSMVPIVPKPKGMPLSTPIPTFGGDDGNMNPVLAKKMPKPKTVVPPPGTFMQLLQEEPACSEADQAGGGAKAKATSKKMPKKTKKLR